MRAQWKADCLLLLVTACWGASYLLTNITLTDMEPITLSAFRFLLAFAVIFLTSFKKVRKVNRKTLKYSLLVGLTLVVTYLSCAFGMLHTSIDNASFLCSMTFAFTPVFGFLFKRQVPEKKFGAAFALTFAGVALLTLNGQFKPAAGDLLCILCAVAYSLDLLITETAVSKPEVDAYQLGVYALAVTGLILLPFSFILEKPHLPTTVLTWGCTLFLGIVCSGIALIVQTVQQQYTTASHAGLIFTMEPVFSALFAYLAVGETLSERGTAGAALMIAAMLIMEVRLKKTAPGIRKVRRRRQAADSPAPPTGK